MEPTEQPSQQSEPPQIAMEDITPSIPTYTYPIPPVPQPQSAPPQQNGIMTNGVPVNNPSPPSTEHKPTPPHPLPPSSDPTTVLPPTAHFPSHNPTPPPQSSEHPAFPPSSTPSSGHKPTPPPAIHREPREKKDSWKKKEAKEVTSKPAPPQTLPTTLPLRLRPPPYRQEDINAIPRLPTFTPAYTTVLPSKRPSAQSQETKEEGAGSEELKMEGVEDGQGTSEGIVKEFFRVSDQPFNKKKFRYVPCSAAPHLPQIMYTQISLPPHCARINWQDMSPYILIDKEALSVTTEKGYRMARTNVCVREGEWFVEFRIERGGGDQGGHTRIGFVRRESTESPSLSIPSSLLC